MALSKNTTIEEIARRANVSIATVSRVINQTGNVHPRTIDKVQKVMKSLDYCPAASRKADRTRGSLLLSLPNMGNPFYQTVIQGIYQVAFQNGYEVFIHRPAAHVQIEVYERIFREQNISGMILAHTVQDYAALETLCSKYPIVMCSECIQSDRIPSVSIDDRIAAKTAINYLLSTARRRIVLLNSPIHFNYARQRELGYSDALKDAGLALDPRRIVHLPEINYNLALSAATNLLRTEPLPDAFFCVSDVFAAAVIKAAANLGYRVPEDIAVVGFDNIELANMMVPSITTIAQPTFQMGVQACKLLLDRINHISCLNMHIVMETELVVRGST